MSDREEFEAQRVGNVASLRGDQALRDLAIEFVTRSAASRYTYNFDFLGLPIIQFPQDMICVQELIWKTRPDLIVETGVARGGSLALSAGILQLIGGAGRAVGIDIDIRPHNRRSIEAHPLAHRITLIEGSSTEPSVVARVREMAAGCERVMVMLDSDHTHDHVLAELRAYGPLVTEGCYLVVFDTIIEDVPADLFADRAWGPGNNPKTAVGQYLAETDRFTVDRDIDARLAISVAPGGYLRCLGAGGAC